MKPTHSFGIDIRNKSILEIQNICKNTDGILNTETYEVICMEVFQI